MCVCVCVCVCVRAYVRVSVCDWERVCVCGGGGELLLLFCLWEEDLAGCSTEQTHNTESIKRFNRHTTY